MQKISRRSLFPLLGTALILTACAEEGTASITNLANSGVTNMSHVKRSELLVKSGKTFTGKPKVTIQGTVTYIDDINDIKDAHTKVLKYLVSTIGGYLKADVGTISILGTATKDGAEVTVSASDFKEEAESLTFKEVKEL